MTLIFVAAAMSQAAAVSSHEITSQEQAFCNSPKSDQPYRFCLADRKHERAERRLASVLAKARHAAIRQKSDIANFTKNVGGVTIEGDPVLALEASQRAWERSYRADCEVSGLAVATGNAGTEGPTESTECEADRIFDRAEFLGRVYSIER